MIVTSLRRDDVDLVTARSRQFARLLERRLGCLPAVHEFALLAHAFDGEVHFFFFFFFFFRTSAWALNASAKDLIWLATKVSAVCVATRSAVTACLRIAFAVFIAIQCRSRGVVPTGGIETQGKKKTPSGAGDRVFG
jgi:hypothetical protein